MSRQCLDHVAETLRRRDGLRRLLRASAIVSSRRSRRIEQLLQLVDGIAELLRAAEDVGDLARVAVRTTAAGP